jgi:hypothetical protein
MIIARPSRSLLPAAVASLFVSCAGLGSSIRHPGCPVLPVSSAELPEPLPLRARMQFAMNGDEAYLEAVAGGTPDALVVVGIAQYGVRLFAVHQRGSEILVEGALSRKFEHLALWTLDALHRALWIRPPPDLEPGAVVSWDWENERVTEVSDEGGRRREFARSGSDRASARVVVRYTASRAGTSRGPRIEIHNPWCGYEAVVVVLEAEGASR